MSWEGALKEFATRVPLSLRWMVVGSAATAIHRVSVRPGDLDILLHPLTGEGQMRQLSDALRPFSGPGGSGVGLDLFVSCPSAPWARDGDWTFGRWLVAETKVEVARIETRVESDCVSETMGEAVWKVREFVTWRGLDVPVVPLRIQLETCRDRGLSERAAAIEQRLGS